MLVATVMVMVSSACCVGPLAVGLSFVGLSTTTLLTVENVLGPFRPLVLGMTGLFLAAGFYTAYRPSPDTCAPGQVCAIPATRRLQRALVWVATGMLAVLLYFTYVHPNLDVLFNVYL